MVPPKAKAEKRPNQAFLTSPQQPFRTGRDIGSYARPEDKGITAGSKWLLRGGEKSLVWPFFCLGFGGNHTSIISLFLLYWRIFHLLQIKKNHLGGQNESKKLLRPCHCGRSHP